MVLLRDFRPQPSRTLRFTETKAHRKVKLWQMLYFHSLNELPWVFGLFWHDLKFVHGCLVLIHCLVSQEHSYNKTQLKVNNCLFTCSLQQLSLFLPRGTPILQTCTTVIDQWKAALCAHFQGRFDWWLASMAPPPWIRSSSPQKGLDFRCFSSKTPWAISSTRPSPTPEDVRKKALRQKSSAQVWSEGFSWFPRLM